ncbi:MAG TPA: hypothetical protein VK850_07870 [Candidatus Binatia bacterium]|nr:hypothetical protein [Candidatus Binatia bacterium]
MRAFAANLAGHAFVFVALIPSRYESSASEVGFNRIIPGWTNYSTAFETTHDTGAKGEFATAATFYTPPYTVRALEFGSIMIWSELPPGTVSFPAFTFSVAVWSDLSAFIAQPGHGNYADVAFVQPSSIRLDGVSRGGRATYEVRFALTNASVILSNCHTYLMAFIARTDTQRNGDLYVPTASTSGASDVQAGNIVPFGWQYLIDAGGFTTYSGQLATELVVEPLGTAPRLFITQSGAVVEVRWPKWASCYGLEATGSFTEPWVAVTNEPLSGTEWRWIAAPAGEGARWFRLRHF